MRYSDIRDREASNILASDIDSSPVLTSALVEVIITEVVRTDPPRKVTQVWSKDGEFIAERDPLNLPEDGGISTGGKQHEATS